MSKRFVILFLLLLLIPAGLVGAQGAPQQINPALADLSERVGFTVGIGDLEQWFWTQDGYDAPCPLNTTPLSETPTAGYQFLLTYDGETYDYRVSADQSLVVLCDITTEGEADPEATPQAFVSEVGNTLCPPQPDIAYPPTRLTANIQARVVPGLPNRLRANPSTDAEQIGEIPAEAIFTVLTGPECDSEGRLWWQVDYDGATGWTAEYSGGEYLVEPVPGRALPTSLTPISATNAGLLTELSRLQGNVAEFVSFPPGGETLLAAGDTGSAGAWRYDLNLDDLTPRLIDGDDPLTVADFGADPDLALFGSADGSVRLWDIAATNGLVERAFLNGHDDPVSAVAFSPGGEVFASSGGLAYLTPEDDLNLYAIVLWSVADVASFASLRGHTGSVTGLAFDAGAETLFSASLDGTLRRWDLATGDAEVYEIGAPITTLALSPDGTTLALGLDNGDVTLVGAEGSILTTLIGHSAAVNAVTFSPDGSLLVSGAADGAINVWDVAAETQLVLLTDHTESVIDVAFHPQSTLIASIGADNTIRLWGVGEEAVG